MRNRNSGFNLFFALVVTLQLGFIGLLLWVAIHFISKVW